MPVLYKNVNGAYRIGYSNYVLPQPPIINSITTGQTTANVTFTSKNAAPTTYTINTTPITSTFSRIAASIILSAGTITPRSTTS